MACAVESGAKTGPRRLRRWGPPQLRVLRRWARRWGCRGRDVHRRLRRLGRRHEARALRYGRSRRRGLRRPIPEHGEQLFRRHQDGAGEATRTPGVWRTVSTAVDRPVRHGFERATLSGGRQLSTSACPGRGHRLENAWLRGGSAVSSWPSADLVRTDTAFRAVAATADVSRLTRRPIPPIRERCREVAMVEAEPWGCAVCAWRGWAHPRPGPHLKGAV